MKTKISTPSASMKDYGDVCLSGEMRQEIRAWKTGWGNRHDLLIAEIPGHPHRTVPKALHEDFLKNSSRFSVGCPRPDIRLRRGNTKGQSTLSFGLPCSHCSLLLSCTVYLFSHFYMVQTPSSEPVYFPTSNLCKLLLPFAIVLTNSLLKTVRT